VEPAHPVAAVPPDNSYILSVTTGGTERSASPAGSTHMGLYLVEPTDFEILAYLAEKGRNNAVNIATALDHNRQYMNARLHTLASHDCVVRIGPAENSGLYEITEKGEGALACRAANSDPDAEFEAAVEAELGRKTSVTEHE
jgi:DNA-binding MarR family transcriptional regulator